MKKFINNIKKYFIYIIGIVFFIIAIYIMLMPPNCALNRMNMKEGFATSSTLCSSKDGKIYDAIMCYRNIVSQKKLDPRKEFDINYLQHYSKSLPDSNKTLIMSRCYQVEGSKDSLLDTISKNQTNIFTSYTETIANLTTIREFSDVLKEINTSVDTFYNFINKGSTTYKSKIMGCVYALIFQIPLYQDTSDPKNINNLEIANNIFPQSGIPSDPLIYYSPSFKGEISKYITKTNTNPSITNTPISYYVYIIYDSYKSGINSTKGAELAKQGNTFSTASSTNGLTSLNGISKSFLDKNYLSGAEQCYIGAIGGSGQNYIGGCTSHTGKINTQNEPLNNVICQSQIQGDTKPWSYFVLYTINRPDIITDIVYNPPDSTVNTKNTK